MPNPPDVQAPIRITPSFFALMLTLAGGVRHGYAMAREVEEQSDGAIVLGPGSLYWSLGRLAGVGLIAEVPAPEGEGDERRRYYTLTPFGRRVLEQEARTLDRMLRFARAKRVV